MTIDRRRGGRADYEVMSAWLSCEQPVEQGIDFLPPPATQRIAQIHVLLVPQAAIHGPGRGNANPIAAIAEIVGERRDEAQASAGFFDAHVTSRYTRAVGLVV